MFDSFFVFATTVLYNVRGAWRSVNEPAFFGGAGSGETDPHLLFLQIN
jgi:hypothetical protein